MKISIILTLKTLHVNSNIELPPYLSRHTLSFLIPIPPHFLPRCSPNFLPRYSPNLQTLSINSLSPSPCFDFPFSFPHLLDNK